LPIFNCRFSIADFQFLIVEFLIVDRSPSCAERAAELADFFSEAVFLVESDATVRTGGEMVNSKFSVQLWKSWVELTRRGRSEKLCNGIALNPHQQVSSCFAPGKLYRLC